MTGIIAVCSAKASPGVTTLAAALVAGWPAARPMLVEADPGGGDLATRLPPRPTNDYPPMTIGWIQRRLPVGVTVLSTPPDQHQADTTVRTAVATGTITDLAERQLTIVDVGRLYATSPALPLATRATVTILLLRPRPDEVGHAPAVLHLLDSDALTEPVLVLRGTGPLSAGQVNRLLRTEVLGWVRDDPAGARVLTGGLPVTTGWRHTRLATAGRRLADHLSAAYPALTVEPDPAATNRHSRLQGSDTRRQAR